MPVDTSTGKEVFYVAHLFRPPSDDEMYVYTKYITRNGKRLYAATYGLKAFRLKVRKSKKRR